MLLVIHNLPKTMRFYEVKKLILDKCGLEEVILDNFNIEGDYKRVTVGLADEGDAALLVRKINGLYMDGCQLFVEDVRQKKLTEQPYRPVENPHAPQLRPENKVQYNRQDDRMAPQPMIDTQPMIPVPPVQMAYSNLPFYMSPIQTSYTNYENQAAHGAIMPQPQAAYYQTQIQQPVMENQCYSLPAYASFPEKPQRLPDEEPTPKSRDRQWEERRRSRSPSPDQFLAPDDEPQRRDRKQAESYHSERGRRSPERHRSDRERSGNKSRHKESDGRSVRDRRERSPPRRRNEGNRASRRDEDSLTSKDPSRIERSPPRDRDFDTRRRADRRQLAERERVYDRNDKRRAVDYRDRERKRSPDRHEKPRDYDKLEKSRYNKPVVEQESDRGFGQKRPYTDVPQSSRTYGNDPDNCTFSVSNASIFEKQPNAREGGSFGSNESDTERGGFDHRAPAKRARFDLNKVASGPPKVDPSKPTSVLNPDMRKMINRHNNWRYQVASIVAKQIMCAARGPGVFPNYPLIYKKLKECVVARIDVGLGDTIVRSLVEMTESYRSRFPPEDDVTFFNAVLEKIERDEKEALEKQLREDDAQVEDNEKVTTGASDIADSAAKDANLMPPPPPQIRIPTGTRPSVPPFQNRGPNTTPQIPNRAPNVTPTIRNSAPIVTPPFQNTTPTVTSHYQNTTPIVTPRFQNIALSTPPTNIAPNPNPYFQNRAPTAFQNTAPHPNPYYQNLPNPNPRFKNVVPTPRFQKSASNPSPQLVVLSPGRMPTPSASKGKSRTLVPIAKVPILNAPIAKVPMAKVPNPKVPMTPKDLKKQKFLHKMEYQNDDIYPVEALLKQAIEDEIAPIVELYSKRPEYFMKNTDHKVFKTISRETTERFKKVIRINLTKRVLDIKTGLVLRIFPVSKWPNHLLFREWMEKNGVLSVKKCPNHYVAMCGSFKAYDDLVAMKSFKVGDLKMDIKTMHMAGPRQSVREKMREASHKQQVPGSSDLLVFDEDEEGAGIDTNDEEEDTHNADATEHDDVIIVEKEKEVVLIEDDDVTVAPGNAESDEGTELTEGADADNDGNYEESLEKSNEETTENVESLEKEQTNEEYLEEGEKSMETGEDLEKDPDAQDTGEDTVEKGEKTLEKSDYPSETLETEFSLTGDNLEAITDEIADDDLEDF